MTKQIEITLLRVTPNGKKIEFIIQCPSDYMLTVFNITVNDSKTIYSVIDSLEPDGDHSKTKGVVDESGTKIKYVGTLPVSVLGVSTPSIFTIHLEMELVEATETDLPVSTDAMISDASGVYNCLADDILKLKGQCPDETILNSVIRNYLILYAHTDAMRHLNFDDASEFFQMMNNCFHPCPPSSNARKGCGCGCSKS